MPNKDQNFWKIRSEGYNNLKWAKDEGYLKAFIKAGDFSKKDLVLDVGTGTGIVTHSISPLVKEVIGLDISQDMLKKSNWKGNKYFIKRDIRCPIFHEEVFDKITARLVFHHITEDTQRAMEECYRILKKGGKMIISEGVPPTDEVKEDYKKIFKLKEKRLVFTEKNLKELMEISGFKNIRVTNYMMKNFSVRNWLENSGLCEEKKRKIFNMHVNAGNVFKKAYNLKTTENDCLITIKNLILVGEK